MYKFILKLFNTKTSCIFPMDYILDKTDHHITIACIHLLAATSIDIGDVINVNKKIQLQYKTHKSSEQQQKKHKKKQTN